MDFNITRSLSRTIEHSCKDHTHIGLRGRNHMTGWIYTTSSGKGNRHPAQKLVNCICGLITLPLSVYVLLRISALIEMLGRFCLWTSINFNTNRIVLICCQGGNFTMSKSKQTLTCFPQVFLNTEVFLAGGGVRWNRWTTGNIIRPAVGNF